MKIGFIKLTFLLLLLISFLSITGCISSRNASAGKSGTAQNIPPGQCRVEAEVIKIDSTLSGISSDPCSKAPCIAWIKIKNVIGYGSGSGTLNNGDTLKVKFAFTLAATDKENFPGLKENFPGLTEGSSFIADIQLLPSNPFSKEKEKVYLVYGYKKTE